MDDVEKTFGPGGAMEAFEAAKKAGKCRFFGFTGHHDPYVHLEMLKRYDRYDSILMPLHAVDPHYLSFGVLSAKECLEYVLSLPVHCTTVGCSTQGQLDDDLRIAQSWRKLPDEQMDWLRDRAVTAGPGGAKGPELEYWKRKL